MVRPHLLIAIHERSLGRSEMAIRMANELRDLGEPVHLLIHDSFAFLLDHTQLAFDIVVDHLQSLTRLLIDNLVQRLNPVSIVYFDFFNTANYLAYHGVGDPRFLLGYDCPTMSLDTWHYKVTGAVVDADHGRRRNLALSEPEATVAAFETISRRLIPVPIARPDAGAGKFACLPKCSGTGIASSWKQELGLSSVDRLVLFCTSRWQHPVAGGAGVARLLPRCLAEYVNKLDPHVHLVHVGPEPYRLAELSPDRYHWLPPIDRLKFEALIRETDLVVAANVSATSIGWAIQHCVPVLMLKNSRVLTDPESVSEQWPGLSARLQEEVRAALPLHPFVLWPLGYHDFLDPLLRNNPFSATTINVEFLDAEAVVESAQLLLHDATARQRVADGQRDYLRQVSLLPSGGEALRRLM